MQNWRVIDDKPYPVQLGLAIDEVLLEKIDSPTHLGPNIIRFYQFDPPSVVLGSHQDIADINVEFVERAGLEIGRRVTGGGAIIMGVPDVNSQLGISVIVKNPPGFPEKLGARYALLATPIITGLRMLGLPVQYDESSDILLHGRKIAGQAIYMTRDVTFFHSTIVIDYDMEKMLGILGIRPTQENLEKFNRNVTTISSEMENLHAISSTVDEIKTKLKLGFQISLNGILREEELSPYEFEQAQKLVASKHSTKEYLYQLEGTTMGGCFMGNN